MIDDSIRKNDEKKERISVFWFRLKVSAKYIPKKKSSSVLCSWLTKDDYNIIHSDILMVLDNMYKTDGSKFSECCLLSPYKRRRSNQYFFISNLSSFCVRDLERYSFKDDSSRDCLKPEIGLQCHHAVNAVLYEREM